MQDWTEYRLDEIALIQGGSTPSRTEPAYFGGDIPWVTPTDLPPIGVFGVLTETKESITRLGLSNSGAKLIAPGSVLFSTRASIGKIAVTEFPCATNQGFANFTPKPDCVDVEFLAFLLARYTSEIKSLAGQTTFLEVPRGKLRGFRVRLPPISEQQRIVARIKECMERVGEIERLRYQILRERSAVWPSLLCESFAEWAALGPLESLVKVADIKGGASLPKGDDDDPGMCSIMLLKVGDMNLEGNERFVTSARSYLQKGDSGFKTIPPGAVIFPKRGGAIATNKKRVLARNALIDPNLMALVPDPRRIASEFLFYWIQTVDLGSLSNGGVIPQINMKDLAPLQLPLPEIERQKEISATLSEAEAVHLSLCNESGEAEIESAYFRAAILRKAFSGEL